ncbi:hypothetical protein YC2023_041005 [Brassica napus]
MLVLRVPCHIGRTTSTSGIVCPECYADSSGFKETPYSLDREDSDKRGHSQWLSITRRCNVAAEELWAVARGLWNPRVSVAPIYGVTSSRYFKLYHCRRPKSRLRVALGKDDRIPWYWTLGKPE